MVRTALSALFTNDIHLEVMRVPFEKLAGLDGGEPSSAIWARVEAARAVQAQSLASCARLGVRWI